MSAIATVLPRNDDSVLQHYARQLELASSHSGGHPEWVSALRQRAMHALLADGPCSASGWLESQDTLGGINSKLILFSPHFHVQLG